MIIDIVVVLGFVLLVVLGFIRGLVKSAVMMVSIPISIVISFIVASPIAAFLNYALGFSKAVAGWFNTSAGNGKILAVVLIAIIIFIVIRIVLHKLTKVADKAKENKHILGKVDRWLGVAFGALRFVVMFSLIAIAFAIITMIIDFIPFIDWNLYETVFSGSKVAKWLYGVIITIIFARSPTTA